jgi:hypothetical protein
MALNPTGGRISIIQKFIEVLHYKAQLYATVGAAAALVGMYLWTIHGCPALRPCHTAALDAEIRTADAARVHSLDDYLRIEDQVFAVLMRLRYNPFYPVMHQTIYRILVWSR